MTDETPTANEVTITDMREFITYPAPGRVETRIMVTYRTDKGYTGTLDLSRDEATEDQITAKIRKSLTPASQLVGKKITI